MQNQKGNIVLIIAGIVAVAILAGGVWYFVYQKTTPKGCTEELKICSDGTGVGRTGPNCEFASCPEIIDEMADWKTYRNEKYGYEIKYPDIFLLDYSNANIDIYCGGPENKDCYGGSIEIKNYINSSKLGLTIKQTSLPINDYLKFTSCNNYASKNLIKQDIVIDNNKGIRCSGVTADHPSGISFDFIIISNQDRMYTLHFFKSGIDADNAVLDKIGDTFKFTK